MVYLGIFTEYLIDEFFSVARYIEGANAHGHIVADFKLRG